MIIRYLFSLLFWLHYSSNPEESIKITRRYCHSIYRGPTAIIATDLLTEPWMPLWTSSPETTESCPERLLHLPLSSFAQQSHRFHWYPAVQQYQRQSLVIWTLTSYRSGTILHSIFWSKVLCRMPFLKHPPHFSQGLGPAQLLLWWMGNWAITNIKSSFYFQ